MIQKIWKDLFHSSEAEIISIVPKEDIEEIIDMLIGDKIDPKVFLSNLGNLLRGGTPSFNVFWRREKTHQPTLSIDYFIRPIDRARAFPLWFYAAYPDIMVWFHERQKEYGRVHNYDEDAEVIEVAKLFGISIEDVTIEKDQIMNSEGKWRPKYLKNLVKYYKDTTDKKLEVSVDEGSKNDIYFGAEFLDAIGAESNFTLIAENTTKYYLELSKKHKNRFNDEISLLATAGILDAQFYIFIDQTINPSEIIDMAKKSVLSDNEALLNFIIELEVKLLKIDTPNMDISEIKNACNDQKGAILKTIKKRREKYNSEPRIALDVESFMNSAKFKTYRKMLGIKNKFLFF